MNMMYRNDEQSYSPRAKGPIESTITAARLFVAVSPGRGNRPAGHARHRALRKRRCIGRPSLPRQVQAPASRSEQPLHFKPSFG